MSDTTDDCIFCEIIAGTIPSTKVLEDDRILAFMDIDPGADGHLLVIPKRHSRDLMDVPADDLAAVTLAAQRIGKAAVAEFGADGVNLLNCCGPAAWQSVYHFHLHVIPRYTDKSRDKMETPFEPGRSADMDAIAKRGEALAAAIVRDQG